MCLDVCVQQEEHLRSSELPELEPALEVAPSSFIQPHSQMPNHLCFVVGEKLQREREREKERKREREMLSFRDADTYIQIQ